MKNIKYIFYISLFLITSYSFAQDDEPEFTLKKTPEEIKLAKEQEEEKKYLKFQNHFFNAIQLKAKEDYTKAIEELEECKQIYPNDAGLNFEFAKNYLLLKDYENTIFFDNKVLESKPNNINVLEHQKKTYKAQRDYDAAISIQNKIIAINPKKETDLIHLYIVNRKIDKAKELFLDLEKRRLPINNKSYYKRVLFPKKRIPKINKPKTIKETVNSKISSNNSSIKQLQNDFLKNNDYKTLKLLIEKEEELNKFNLLEKDTKKGLELFPAQPYLYFMQGKAQNKLVKYNEAIDVLKAGLDFIIDNNKLEADIYMQIHKAYLSLGKHSEANKYLEKANKLKQKK